MGKIKFNGKTSEDFGLVIQTPPTYEYPERDLTVAHVPGRNGDVIIDNKCYKNVQRTYSIGIKYYQSSGYYANFESILDWLNSSNGKYARLEDSYDSDVYRLASFQMNGSFIDYFGKGGVGTITFECKPQRFLKEGEKDILFNSNEAEIVNESSYVAKPLITVSGIETDFDNVLMMSVIDHFGKATSSITISSYEGTMLFDSEDEVVTDRNGNDLSTNVGMNSLPFPELKTGRNEIIIERYQIESTTVDAYSTILVGAQHTCRSEYKTYAAIQQTAQEKIFIKSYKTLIRSKQESYSANSVQSYMSQKAEIYTFDSFNTLLNNYVYPYSFTGDAATNNSTSPEWIELTPASDGRVLLTAKINGFYRIDGVDKKIYFRHMNESLIESGVSANSVNTIYFYAAKVVTPEQGNPLNYPLYDGSYYALDIGYIDIPDWLDFKVEYDNDKSPVKIHYYRNADGYYWSDKTWIFGKAQWSYYNHAVAGSEALLASLKWDTSKKAFTNVSGLSLSTTSTFTYRYLDCDPQNLPDYEPIVTTDIDDRGVETVDVKSAVHFRVVDQGDGGQNPEYHLSRLTLYPKDVGYYCYSVSDGEPTNWRKIDDISSPIIIGMSGTTAFGILYLSQAPDYSGEEDWPEWLDPIPIGTQEEPDLVLTTKIYFKVLSNGTYRVSADTEDDTPQSHMWSQSEPYGWKNQNANDYLTDLMSSKTVESAMYIYKIDESTISMQYDYNRSYTVNDGDPSSTLPSWLIAENDPTVSADQVPDTIKYKANASGYFKWDSNESWVYYNAGSELLIIGGKDDCIVYYTETLPAYAANNFGNQDMFALFDVEVVQSPNPGNPKEVNFKIKNGKTGYYRANNGMSWKYLTEGETLLTSKIGDMVYLYHLKAPENPDLDNISITIKPRWWKL